MDESEIIAKLDQLAEYRNQREILERDKAQRLKDAIPPEVQAELDVIVAEFDPPLEQSALKVGELESEIRDAILERQTSVKGASLYAVYTAPRVTWDNRSLDGYAVAHPELLNFQRIGQPSVSIRELK